MKNRDQITPAGKQALRSMLAQSMMAEKRPGAYSRGTSLAFQGPGARRAFDRLVAQGFAHVYDRCGVRTYDLTHEGTVRARELWQQVDTVEVF